MSAPQSPTPVIVGDANATTVNLLLDGLNVSNKLQLLLNFESNASESILRLTELLAKQKDDIDNVLKNNINSFFLILNAIVVFLMQAGFAYLECGAVRSKNATNILIKNLLDALFGALSYWLVGYAFANGDETHTNSLIGYSHFAGAGLGDKWASWFFQFVFAATAATIVSGAVAERCSFVAYFVYSLFITGFVYPVVTHWGWHSEGWLAKAGYSDFAGSGIVHLLGGVAAFTGAVFLGPRIGRFDSVSDLPMAMDDERGRTANADADDKANGGKIQGHSVPLAALGGFLLIVGFFSFNGGSLLSIVNRGQGATFGKIVANTMLAGSSSGVVALMLNRIPLKGNAKGKFSILVTINGILAGMISICCGCDKVRDWGAVAIGAFAGPFMMFCSWTVARLGIDDPLDAFAVHAGGGSIGLILTPFFWEEHGLLYGNVPTADGSTAACMLGMNVAGLLAITLWTAVLCSFMFGCLKLAGFLRVDPECEVIGMDITKHGEPAYPIAAYGGDYWNVHADRKTSIENLTTDDPAIASKDIPTFSLNNNAAYSAGEENQGFQADSPV